MDLLDSLSNDQSTVKAMLDRDFSKQRREKIDKMNSGTFQFGRDGTDNAAQNMFESTLAGPTPSPDKSARWDRWEAEDRAKMEKKIGAIAVMPDPIRPQSYLFDRHELEEYPSAQSREHMGYTAPSRDAVIRGKLSSVFGAAALNRKTSLPMLMNMPATTIPMSKMTHLNNLSQARTVVDDEIFDVVTNVMGSPMEAVHHYDVLSGKVTRSIGGALDLLPVIVIHGKRYQGSDVYMELLTSAENKLRKGETPDAVTAKLKSSIRSLYGQWR